MPPNVNRPSGCLMAHDLDLGKSVSFTCIEPKSLCAEVVSYLGHMNADGKGMRESLMIAGSTAIRGPGRFPGAPFL